MNREIIISNEAVKFEKSDANTLRTKIYHYDQKYVLTVDPLNVRDRMVSCAIMDSQWLVLQNGRYSAKTLEKLATARHTVELATGMQRDIKEKLVFVSPEPVIEKKPSPFGGKIEFIYVGDKNKKAPPTPLPKDTSADDESNVSDIDRLFAKLENMKIGDNVMLINANALLEDKKTSIVPKSTSGIIEDVWREKGETTGNVTVLSVFDLLDALETAKVA